MFLPNAQAEPTRIGKKDEKKGFVAHAIRVSDAIQTF